MPPADDASSPTCLIRVSVHFEEADDSCANVARYDGTEASAAEERKKRVKRRPEAGAEGARAARRMEGARAEENDDDDDDEYNEDSIITGRRPAATTTEEDEEGGGRMKKRIRTNRSRKPERVRGFKRGNVFQPTCSPNDNGRTFSPETHTFF